MQAQLMHASVLRVPSVPARCDGALFMNVVPPRGRRVWNARTARVHCLVGGSEGDWAEAARRAHSSLMSNPMFAGHAANVEPEDKATSISTEDLTRLQAFEAYSRELAKPAEDVDLLKCAALIARATVYPHVEVAEVKLQVWRLSAEVRRQLGDGPRYPLHVLRTIIAVLYNQKGFHGNAIDYYDPDNSYINQVLLNKSGIPITLSLLFMEVARNVGLPMKGVNLPAHFMIQPDVDDVELLVDPFAGELLWQADAESKLSRLMQMDVRLDPAFIRARKGVPPRQFLMRMLNNLKQIYLMTSKVDIALRIIRLMRATQPEAASELRDEGLCLYSLGRYQEALDVLGKYTAAQPRAEDATMVANVMDGCRTLLREQAAELAAEQRLRDGHGPTTGQGDLHA